MWLILQIKSFSSQNGPTHVCSKKLWMVLPWLPNCIPSGLNKINLHFFYWNEEPQPWFRPPLYVKTIIKYINKNNTILYKKTNYFIRELRILDNYVIPAFWPISRHHEIRQWRHLFQCHPRCRSLKEQTDE